MERVFIGKVVRSACGDRPPALRPEDGTALDALTVAVIALSSPLSTRKRQHLTGVLTWATIHHRLALPFLSALHRWTPAWERMPQDTVVEAGTLAAVLAALP